VQNTISLDQIAKNDKPQFGELKFTIASFPHQWGHDAIARRNARFHFPPLRRGNFGESASTTHSLDAGQVRDYSPAMT